MFTYYWESLFPHWLAIISFFPETLDPLDYEKLLPECDSEGQLFLLYQRELRQKDWCERNEFNEIIHTEEDNEAQFLYDSDPSLAAYRNIQLTPDLLRKWYKSRAYEIEKNSYMIDNALQLVKIAKSHNINGLEELLLDLEVLYDLVYKVYLEDISLDRLQELSHLEKIKLLMSTSDEKSFVDNIKNLLLPFIKTRHQYLGGDIQKHLLHDYLISLSKDDLKLVVKLFEYLKQSQDPEIIQMCDDVSELATNCIYACNDLDMHQKAKYILDTIPKDRDGKRIGAASTFIEDLERELEYAQVLSKYGVKTTLSYINKNKNNPETVKLLLIQMARNLNKIIPPPDEKQWAQLLNDMLEIHGQLFTCVDIEICFEICVSARLVSGIKSNIQNCAALIETKKNEQSLLKVSYEKAVGLILDASKEYFNSSKSLTDSSMELAKACLHLIADDNTQIKQEYDLINSLQILNEFNVDILPLQVRLTQERLKLIEECLIRREEAYKCRQRLLKLANYLRIEENNSRALEGKVLELIAKRAFEVKDYTVCATTCEQLMQNNYIPAWTIALDVGYCEEFRDLKTRQKCLWFTVNNGPSDILGKTLEQLQLIEIQMLHKNLEMWMPANDQEGFNEEGDSEEEFIDAMTTPQVEVKEFVPKVLETSTGIVKSSANIMKESTFSLIKGISDTNFWKSKLKFNFGSSLDNEAHEAENESERTNYIQSFPCFYGSIHEKCKISNFDTNYMKYSMPDIPNVKLKCCQALLRIAVLSESTCYKKEVSDISHLLLECAKHTIPEDWLLGIAYLLSLNKSYIPDAQSIFMDLPETDLWIQTATYYYSLELHKVMHTNFENLYLYDPLDLINKMVISAQTCKECDVQMSLQFWQRKLFGDLKDIKPMQSEKKRINCAENTTDDNPDPDTSTSITEISIRNTDSEVISSEQKDTVEESNLKEEIEWTDDWKDFSDDDTGYIKNKRDTPYENFSLKERNYLELDISKCSTEKDYFEFFRKAFKKIRNEKDYQNVKRLLLDCPKFVDPEFTTADSHPILKMIEITTTFITKKNTLNYEKNILQEYRELVESLTSTEILKEFLEKTESQRPVEHNIYIRLCTEDPLLYNEAIDIIKEKCEGITLPPTLLEEIFLKNLTASFNPDHIIYNQIIEHVFTNRSLINIEENANILVRELKRQKHIGNALHIIKLMEAIPPSLTTFDSCLHLLSRK